MSSRAFPGGVNPLGISRAFFSWSIRVGVVCSRGGGGFQRSGVIREISSDCFWTRRPGVMRNFLGHLSKMADPFRGGGNVWKQLKLPLTV